MIQKKKTITTTKKVNYISFLSFIIIGLIAIRFMELLINLVEVLR